jgi:hypothetical protein
MTNKMPFYVYTHQNPTTKEILYVGIGQYDRAWCIRQNNRNKEHTQYLKNLFKEGFTLTDIVTVTDNMLSKQKAMEIEAEKINEYRPKFNKLLNKNHWHIARQKTKEMCEFAKALKEMGYGYQRISFLLGSSKPKNNAMSVKRMLTYV